MRAEALYERALAMAPQLDQVRLQCMVLLHFARMQERVRLRSSRSAIEVFTIRGRRPAK